MSTDDGRLRRTLRALRVSGYNLFTSMLFVTVGVVLLLTTDWPLSWLLIVTGAAQYVVAVAIRASGAGDVLRVTFFEPADERDREIGRRASALTGDIALLGSLIAFLASVIVGGAQSMLSVYLAWQTFVLAVIWLVVNWITARLR
ncbi:MULTISPECIES: hypothetical protein [Brevibacterium]|uniref:Uncharacterized protein n=1 Tax=Brevibacterium salitolerans TaxID=1403566 RepID=A0ABN2WZ43_9MICO|nr:hypothetical protein [Brevibacterium sp.]